MFKKALILIFSTLSTGIIIPVELSDEVQGQEQSQEQEQGQEQRQEQSQERTNFSSVKKISLTFHHLLQVRKITIAKLQKVTESQGVILIQKKWTSGSAFFSIY